jgi:hypothetical protein
MMILYLFLLLLLFLARFLVVRRAVRLERKYDRSARQARDLMSQPAYKQGNNSRPDMAAQARQQYLLGQAVEKRDRVEARYVVWQARAESLGKLIVRIRGWKGRVVPYVSGVVDAAVISVLLNMLGMIDVPALTEAIASLKARWGG